MKLDELVEIAKTGVLGNQREFNSPDDDWMPILLVSNGEDVTGGLFDPAFMNDKDGMAAAIAQIITETKGDAAVLVTSAWMSVMKGAAEMDDFEREAAMQMMPAPSEDPERQECVMMVAADVAGSIDGWSIEIKRDGIVPPTLADEWTHSPELGGRMADALRIGLEGARSG